MVENSKEMNIFTIGCYLGNSLQYTHLNENETPGVLLIFTANARGLNPKVKQVVHTRLVLHPSSGEGTVNTEGSHLKRWLILSNRN